MHRLNSGRVVGAVLAAVVGVGLAPTLASAQGTKQADPGSQTTPKGMVDLRPKFKAGQSSTYRMQIKQSAKTKQKDDSKLKGDNQSEASEYEITFSLKVKSVDDDGTAHVDLVYDAVKMSGDVNGEKIGVDSSKPASTDKGEAAAGVRAMAGSTMSLVVDKDGNITQTSGGGGFLGGGQGQGSDLLGPIFSPGKAPGAAKPGQSWTNVDEVGMGGMLGPMRLVTRHTLDSATKTEARIRVTGTIETGQESPGGKPRKKPAKKDDPDQPDLSDMVRVTKNDHSGAYVWDLERGQIKSMNTSMKTELKLDLGGMEMTRSGDTQMKLERIKADPVEQAPKDKPVPADPKPESDPSGKPEPKRK
jgi:hypothetical protein